jgi:hypothetical protein
MDTLSGANQHAGATVQYGSRLLLLVRRHSSSNLSLAIRLRSQWIDRRQRVDDGHRLRKTMLGYELPGIDVIRSRLLICCSLSLHSARFRYG